MLRPHHSERRVTHRAPAPPAAKPAATDATPAALSPAEKEDLFRDFDAYLSGTGARR